MSGAYVAKPDAVVVPDLPPGWNILWQHPGPFPPGYTPEYSGLLSAPSEISVGDLTANVSLTLVDQGSYATNEPSANSATWEVDASSSGGPSGEFSESDDFWIDSGIYAFSGVEIGGSITVTVTSYPFGDDWPIEETAIIDVVAASPSVYHVEVACVLSTTTSMDDPGGTNSSSAIIKCYLVDYSGSAGVVQTRSGNDNPLEDTWALGSTFSELSDRLYKKYPLTSSVRVENWVEGRAVGGEWAGSDTSASAEATLTYTVNVYKDDILFGSYSDVITISVSGSGVADIEYWILTHTVTVSVYGGAAHFSVSIYENQY